MGRKKKSLMRSSKNLDVAVSDFYTWRGRVVVYKTQTIWSISL